MFYRLVYCLLFCSFLFSSRALQAQYNPDYIKTNVVLNERRQHFDTYMKAEIIGKISTQPLDSNTESKYESACLAASQFMIQSDAVKAAMDTLFLHYDSLEYSTRRALLEAVYGLYHTDYLTQIAGLFVKETEPKLFAMQAVYLFRADSSRGNVQRILQQQKRNFPFGDSLELLRSLKQYVSGILQEKRTPVPPLASLFSYQATIGKQMIYSLQRWNRDYPGMVILQNQDGTFARDSSGKLLIFQQLARSASDLPYFITSGNTPQGIYSVQGTAVSHNNLIGPTPNLQLLMPYENNGAYWHRMPDSLQTFQQNYSLLLPPDWRHYLPMQEAVEAGSIGRTAIIAHGSTIDPAYFKGKPYYPLTPTLGCLCAKEDWNIFTGKFNQSDQFNLVETYLAREEDESGYLIVVNIDNKQAPVNREEIEKIVGEFEKNRN